MCKFWTLFDLAYQVAHLPKATQNGHHSSNYDPSYLHVFRPYGSIVASNVIYYSSFDWHSLVRQIWMVIQEYLHH